MNGTEAPNSDTTSTPVVEPTELSPLANGHIASSNVRLFETLAVLALAVIPGIVQAARMHMAGPQPVAPTFQQFALLALLRCLQIGPILLFVMWRSGDSWRSFGVTRVRLVRDSLIGIAAFVVAFGAYYVVFYGAYRLFTREIYEFMRGTSTVSVRILFQAPYGIAQWLSLVGVSVTNGFVEELTMRSYLLTRLEQLLRSPSKAYILSTALFAAYHVYQGRAGVINAAIMGAVLGFVFIRSRRIWPVAIAHAIGDFIPLAMLRLW
jgi:membrane protease YdiL (CAAX protease family)